MDFQDKKDRYNEIMNGIGKDLKPIFDRLVNQSNEIMDSKSNVDYTEYVPPCGITERNKPLTEEQIKDASDLVEQAIESIQNTEDFPEIKNQLPRRTTEISEGGGSGGSERGRIKPIPLQYPLWLEDVESELKAFYKRKKGRKGIDWEEAVKGRIAKAKERLIKRDSAVYVFMDTSGSMWWNTDKNGVPLIKIFGSFFPLIAEQYQGEVWLADSSPYNAKNPIKNRYLISDFKMNDGMMKDFNVLGGGGTEFWGIFQMFDKKVREVKERNSEAKVMLIFFSDMEADFRKYPELIEGKDIMFVTDVMPRKGHDIYDYVNGDNIKLITTEVK